MKRLFILAAFLLAPGLTAAPALAQPSSGFAQTATATAFSPTSGGGDPYGMISEGGFSQGVTSGSHINGTFTMQEARSHSADGLSGTLTGQFTMVDGVGNSVSGTVSGQFVMDASGSSAQGQYSISGGTGAYASVAGSGSFSESFGVGGAPTMTFGGTLFNNTTTYSPPNPYLAVPGPSVSNIYTAPQYAPNVSQSFTTPAGVDIGTAPGLPNNVTVISPPFTVVQPPLNVTVPSSPPARASCASQVPRDNDPYGSQSYSATGELCAN
jgi:hypothetical protein